LNGCTFFSEKLDGCEISILNYNLYQVKEHIRAQLAHAREASPSIRRHTLIHPASAGIRDQCVNVLPGVG
jgi:hypothetical protein